jgi:hypothetical protein
MHDAGCGSFVQLARDACSRPGSQVTVLHVHSACASILIASAFCHARGKATAWAPTLQQAELSAAQKPCLPVAALAEASQRWSSGEVLHHCALCALALVLVPSPASRSIIMHLYRLHVCVAHCLGGRWRVCFDVAVTCCRWSGCGVLLIRHCASFELLACPPPGGYLCDAWV